MKYDPVSFLAQSKLKDLGFYTGPLDGIWGPVSLAAATAWVLSQKPATEPVSIVTDSTLDSRTISIIATLDPNAQAKIRNFMLLARPIAGIFGCAYKLISGYRTWEQQAALYKACQNGGAHAVPAGYSMHNFKLAVDAGVFRITDGKYLDDGTNSEQAIAEKVHLACSRLAPQCGLMAGATWTGRSNDQPHYQIDIGHATPTDADRSKFKTLGSLL